MHGYSHIVIFDIFTDGLKPFFENNRPLDVAHRVGCKGNSVGANSKKEKSLFNVVLEYSLKTLQITANGIDQPLRGVG
jgi:hypothetical protein